jgi:hypothetical protein
MKRPTIWISTGVVVAALACAARWVAGCTTGQCSGECPSGTIPDSTGCACLQGGPTCDPNSPQPVQDGGAVVPNCCPREVLQSTLRTTPVGPCTGHPQCFVAVHQVCEGSAGGPIDEYTCTCDGASWQCSLKSSGASVCPFSDAGAGSD